MQFCDFVKLYSRWLLQQPDAQGVVVCNEHVSFENDIHDLLRRRLNISTNIDTLFGCWCVLVRYASQHFPTLKPSSRVTVQVAQDTFASCVTNFPPFTIVTDGTTEFLSKEDAFTFLKLVQRITSFAAKQTRRNVKLPHALTELRICMAPSTCNFTIPLLEWLLLLRVFFAWLKPQFPTCKLLLDCTELDARLEHEAQAISASQPEDALMCEEQKTVQDDMVDSPSEDTAVQDDTPPTQPCDFTHAVKHFLKTRVPSDVFCCIDDEHSIVFSQFGYLAPSQLRLPLTDCFRILLRNLRTPPRASHPIDNTHLFGFCFHVEQTSGSIHNLKLLPFANRHSLCFFSQL